MPAALPCRGAVLEVDTYVFSNGDHADHRWVVVIRPPATENDFVTVVQRSSTARGTAGVPSPARSIGCFTKDGDWVLRYSRTVRWFELAPVIAHECGQLPGAELTQLIAAWEDH